MCDVLRPLLFSGEVLSDTYSSQNVLMSSVHRSTDYIQPLNLIEMLQCQLYTVPTTK